MAEKKKETGKTEDLFSHSRREDGGEKFLETRLNTKPLMEDNQWRPLVVQYVYDQGYAGVKLSKLLHHGVEREWWQPRAAKHFGEKMRVAFSTGLICVPVFAGVSKLHHIVVVHPAFITLTCDHPVLQADIDRMREHMMRQDYVKQNRPRPDEGEGHDPDPSTP